MLERRNERENKHQTSIKTFGSYILKGAFVGVVNTYPYNQSFPDTVNEIESKSVWINLKTLLSMIDN